MRRSSWTVTPPFGAVQLTMPTKPGRITRRSYLATTCRYDSSRRPNGKAIQAVPKKTKSSQHSRPGNGNGRYQPGYDHRDHAGDGSIGVRKERSLTMDHDHLTSRLLKGWEIPGKWRHAARKSLGRFIEKSDRAVFLVAF